uniref:Uncharacterized protein n=1 Tax=Cyprinus carpio TaxID=7962 RepID=A0A8C2GY15_CYPCA
MDTSGSICQHSGLIDSGLAVKESVIQQHLTHYKQATETAREELAVLQTKYIKLQSQLLVSQSKVASQEATLKNLKNAKQEVAETQRRCETLMSLNQHWQTNLCKCVRKERPPLEQSVKLYEVECKASRETDVEREQLLSASRVNELNSSRQVSYRK